MDNKYPIVEKTWEHLGLCCAVLFQDLGFRCGYVLVPKGHPWYGIDYMELDVCVHGGLTYGAVGLKNVNDNDWWIGFDCGHWGDGREFHDMFPSGSHVWTKEEVIKETELLAEQVKTSGEKSVRRKKLSSD